MIAAGPTVLEDLTREDLEAVRLLLGGRSVIDWHRLDFQGPEEVARFLRINEYDLHAASDVARLEQLRTEAVGYLRRTFEFPIPAEVAAEVAPGELLLIASRPGPLRRWACVVLKVMHIVNHLAGRELALRLPIAADVVYRAVELKVMQVIEDLRLAGYAIDEFAWSRKPADSLITKLLSKRSTLATEIYDKLRFRLVVPRPQDLVPMLAVLMRHVFPFNYVVPGATVNRLVALERTLRASEALRHLESTLQVEPPEIADDRDLSPPENEFSARDYRVINFVTDVPIRLSGILPADQLGAVPPGAGHIVFVMAEFQLADRQTTIDNQQGDASHQAYKARQQRRVRARLLDGQGGEER